MSDHTNTTQPIPEGFHSVTPYLVMKNAKAAIEFYVEALDAKIMMCLDAPDGSVAHGELLIGNSYIMLTEENPEMGFVGPETLGGAGVSLMLYVEDVDQTFAQAIAAGCVELRPVIDQFYGDRAGTLKDPYGHVWTIGTHKEDLTEDEVNARMAEYIAKCQ